MKNIKQITSIISLAFILISMVFYNYYSLIENQSGHTGLELIKFKFAYLIFAIVTLLVGFIIKTDKKAKKLFIISGILGFIFIANIWLFEKTGIMMNYEDWLK